MQPSFQTSIRESGDVTVLDLKGALKSGDASDSLRETVRTALATNKRKFLINLEKVSTVDSMGIGCLVACFVTVGKEGGIAKLLKPTGPTRIALAWTGITAAIETYMDEQEALASFR